MRNVAHKHYAHTSETVYSGPNNVQLVEAAITNPLNGEVLGYNSATANWENGSLTIPSNLDDLTDVTITSAQDDQVLTWDGAKWVNANATRVVGMFLANDTRTVGANNTISLCTTGTMYLNDAAHVTYSGGTFTFLGTNQPNDIYRVTVACTTDYDSGDLSGKNVELTISGTVPTVGGMSKVGRQHFPYSTDRSPPYMREEWYVQPTAANQTLIFNCRQSAGVAGAFTVEPDTKATIELVATAT